MFSNWVAGQAGNAFSGGALVGPGAAVRHQSLLCRVRRCARAVRRVQALRRAGPQVPGLQLLRRRAPELPAAARSPEGRQGGARHRRVDGGDAGVLLGPDVPGLRAGRDAGRRRHGHRRRGPGRRLDLPAGEGGARGRPGVGRDPGQLLPPAEGQASEQGRGVPLVDAVADRLRARAPAEPGLGRGVEGSVHLAARPAHGQERRRQPRQPGQDLRRGRPLVPRHRRRDPQHQRAAARHEAAHAGRARRQRPVADLPTRRVRRRRRFPARSTRGSRARSRTTRCSAR